MRESPGRGRRILRCLGWCAAIVLVLVLAGFSGIVFAWTRFAQSLPDLRGWHLQMPESEFHSNDETDVYTFDDYLKQENKVFAELDALVATAWAGERAGKFCRYKADSVCNPRTLYAQNWNRTFVLESAKPIGGVLLVHGLSDSPYSLRAIGEALHRAGYTVIGLRVPGHGTCPKALADASWEDWAASVRIGMKGLRARVPAELPLIMVGYSNGGALCVNHVASSMEHGGSSGVSAIVLISPMIGISPMAEFTQLYPTVAKLSGEKKLAWSGIEQEIDPFKYSSWPTSASLQAHLITRNVEKSLSALSADGRMAKFPPVLTVQSVVDSTVITHRMIDVLMDRLPPGSSELILFDVRRDELVEGLINSGFEQDVRPRLVRGGLPFTLTFVTSRSPASEQLVARTYQGSTLTESEIGVAWPPGVFSLSHVALPIPESDPVYGPGSPESPVKLPLGKLSLRGESGVLAFSPTLLMRIRYNPFYDWTEKRVLTWIDTKIRK